MYVLTRYTGHAFTCILINNTNNNTKTDSDHKITKKFINKQNLDLHVEYRQFSIPIKNTKTSSIQE